MTGKFAHTVAASPLDCLLPAICGRVALGSTWRKVALSLDGGELSPRRLSKTCANQRPVKHLCHVLLGLALSVNHSLCSWCLMGHVGFIVDIEDADSSLPIRNTVPVHILLYVYSLSRSLFLYLSL